ncbi:eCIS core domain-containing protein [Tropicibacter sp. S64]|uniref:eCIS core domain-containing protein n=1 Tax=Tropicibacter sp. S64 TaxID=3415122 RepID=UPI003C7D9A24
MSRGGQEQTRLTGKRATGRVLEDEARQAGRGRLMDLSRAPAARLPGDAGAGRALSADIRARLEDAFGADLSGLTIHDGPEAAALARQTRARAFAAGPHLVFADGAYRPGTSEGFRLLRHETAHALQQTGAETAQGLRLVKGGASSGPVQKDDPPTQEEEDMARAMWTGTLKAYEEIKPWEGETGLPKGADYAADVAALTKASGGKIYTNKKTTHGAALATFILGYRFRSLRGCSLAADILTGILEFDAVIALIRKKPTLEQAVLTKALGDYATANVPAEDMVKLFITDAKSPYVKRQWDAMLERVLTAARTVGEAIPARSKAMDLYDTIRLYPSSDRTRPNALQLLTISSIGAVENAILDAMRNSNDPKVMAPLVEESFGAFDATSPVLKVLARLRGLSFDLTKIVEKGGTSDPFSNAAVDVLQGPVARLAERFTLAFKGFSSFHAGLGMGLVDFAAIRSGGALKLPAALTTFLDALAVMADTDTPSGTFELLPKAAGEAVGGEGSDAQAEVQTRAFLARMQKPSDFDTRRRTLISQVRDKALDLRGALNAMKLPKADLKDDQADAMTAMVFALMWTEWFTAFADATPQQGGADADQVAAARYALARAMGGLGQILMHPKLTSEAMQVAKARDAGLSYAAIPKWAFKEDTSKPFAEALPKEIKTIGGNWSGPGDAAGKTHYSHFAVPVDVLVEFYQIDFLRRALPLMTAEIARQQVIVDQNKKTARAEDKKLPGPDSIQTVLDGVDKTMPRPRRWVAEDGVLVQNPDDTATPLEVLMRHPAVMTRLGEADPKASGGARGISGMWHGQHIVRQQNRWTGVDLWTLPDLGPLRDSLRSVPQVAKILKEWKKSGGAWSEPEAAHLWLFQLYDYAKQNGGLEALRKDMRGTFDARLETENEKLRQALRQLSTLNRGIYVDYFRDRLAASVKTTEMKGRHDILFDAKLTGDLRGAIFDFSRSVRPREDQDIQTVALMIEVAPQLLAAISVRTNGDHIQSFFEPVALALSMATGSIVFGVSSEGASGKDIGTPAPGVTADFQKRMGELRVTPGELAKGVEILRQILRTLDAARRENQQMFKLHGDPKKGLKTKLAGYWIDPADKATSMFVLALPYRSDVRSGGKWDTPEPPKATPLDAATGQSEDTAKPKLNPIWMSNIIYQTDYPIYYEITKVHRSFTYMPAYKAHGAARVEESLTDEKDRKIGKGVDLVTFRFAYMDKSGGEVTFSPAREVTVQSGDIELLDLLNNLVDYQGRLLSMQNLANIIEASGELFLDLLEFVPGVGQAVMLARLAANVVDMIVNMEWDEIREDLVKAPQEIMEFLKGELLAELQSADMFSFFLNTLMSNTGAADRIRKALDKAEERAKKRKEKARLKPRTGKKAKTEQYRRLMGTVSGIAIDVGQGLLKAQEKMGIGVKAAAAKVVTSQVLTRHIDRLPVYLGYADLFVNLARAAEAMVSGGKAGSAADWLSAQSEFAGGGAGSFKGAITAMMEPLVDLQLPKEIIPMDLAVQIILDMTIGRVRNKKIKIVYEALRLTGGLAKISQLIADNLFKGSSVDPNTYWRDDIAGKIAPAVTTGRDLLVEQVFSLMRYVFPKAGFETPELSPILADWSEPKLHEEVAPYGMAWGFPSLVHPMTALPKGGGAPLDDRMRRDLEGRFGYDLGHLRVHDDGPAQDFTQAIGAEAAASGSHVYLGQGFDVRSEHGKHVMRHEVAHALQQTRPPVLGTGTPPAPKPGQSGRGLRHDPMREQGAERMAHAARTRSASEDGPMRIEGEGQQAILPYGRDTLVAMLQAIGTEKKTAHDFGDMKRTQNKLTQGSTEDRTAVTSLLSDLQTQVATAKRATSMKYGSASEGQLRDELTKVVGGWTEDQMLRIASSVVTEIDEAKKKKLNLKSKFVLDFPKLFEIVEGVIFADTGITVSLKRTKATPPRLSSVEIEGVHFGGVRGGSNLYTHIKDQNATVGAWEFHALRSYLRNRFPVAHLWEKGPGMKISEEGLTRVSSTITIGELPVWSEYVKTGFGKSKQALRVGLHGQLTGATRMEPLGKGGANVEIGSAGGRESHHVPQYLLVEFYRGVSKKPGVNTWGATGDYWVPGFTGTGVKPLERPKGKKEYTAFEGDGFKVDLAKLDPNSERGSGMPTVSLATDTHQKGQLHMSGKSAWGIADELDAPLSQGVAMYGHYVGKMVSGAKAKKSLTDAAPGGLDTPGGFRGMVDAVMTGAKAPGNNSGQAALSDLHKVTEATMKAGYVQFVGYMKGQLKKGLEDLEVETYRTVARTHSGYSKNDSGETFPKGYEAEASSSWINAVVAALKEKNKQQFGDMYVASAW